MNHNDNELILTGTTLSPGIAVGKAFLYHDILTRDVSSYSINGKDVPAELKRITDAFEDVRKELHKLDRTVSQAINTRHGTIFEAQRMMMDDEEFINSFEKEMRDELINAEQVAKNVFRKYIDRFSASTHDSVKAKADDIRDIFRKVLRSLLGIETSILTELPRKTIIIARRLLPSDTVKIDQRNIEGIIVQEGSIHAHSAMLARSLGIPALCTDGRPIFLMNSGEKVIIDGYSDRAVINPDRKTLSALLTRKKQSSLERKKKTEVIPSIVTTRAGRTIQMLANANSIEDVTTALQSGCDGIGLFRTETLYLQNKYMPDENDLFNSLKAVIEAAGDKPVTIRLVDIGGDKRLPYFELDEEFSPFLGLRGIRLLLRNRELLKTQLRALFRLRSFSDFRVLLPMVTVPEEITELRTILADCRKEFGLADDADLFQIGSMVETPASALAIERIVAVSDFISIGTNDLTQYIMAASRENPNVAHLYEKGFEYVLPLVENIARVCRQKGKECGICGETANDERYLEKFIAAGVTQFSVAAYRLPYLKASVKKLKV